MTDNDGIIQPRSVGSLTHSARPVTDLVEVVGEDEYGKPFTAICYAESETHKALLAEPSHPIAFAATIAGGDERDRGIDTRRPGRRQGVNGVTYP